MTTIDTVANIEGDPIISLSYRLAPDVPFEKILWRIDSKPFNVQNGRGRARYISYIDARTAGEILDEWVGPDAWAPAYRQEKLLGQDVVWCDLTIDFPTGRTVTRSDVGVAPGGDANVNLKGIVSDSFKRAAVMFGVGRNVYHLPEVWAPCAVTGQGKARPVPEANSVIAAELRKAGIASFEGINVDGATEDNGSSDPPAETHLPDDTERIIWAAKLSVWRLFGVDENDDPFDAAKSEAAGLWERAVEKAGIRGQVVTPETAEQIIDTAEKLLEADAAAHAAQVAADPDMRPFDDDSGS